MSGRAWIRDLLQRVTERFRQRLSLADIDAADLLDQRTEVSTDD